MLRQHILTSRGKREFVLKIKIAWAFLFVGGYRDDWRTHQSIVKRARKEIIRVIYKVSDMKKQTENLVHRQGLKQNVR
jgi:acetone carboxylase gamma subunit